MSSLETKVLGVAEAVEEATLNAPVPTLSEAKPHLDTLAIAIAADVRLQAQTRGDFVARVLALRDESDVAAVYDPTGTAVVRVNDKIETLCAEVMVAREDTPAMTAEMLALPSAAPTIAEIAEAFLPFGVDTPKPTVKAAVTPKVQAELAVSAPAMTHHNSVQMADRTARVERYKAECLSQGMTRKEAAAHLGVSVSSIDNYRRILGGAPGAGSDHSGHNLALAAEREARADRYKTECLSQGMSTAEAAAHLGVSESSVRNYHRDLVAKGDARPFSSDSHNARMAAAAIDRYKTECLSQGMSTAEASAHLGVSPKTIAAYHRRLAEKGEAQPLRHGVRVDQQTRWQRNVGRFATECRGMSCAEAAAHLGVSPATISRYSKAAGIKLHREIPVEVKVRRQRLVDECVPRGMTRLEAAARLGVTPEVITSDCKALGVKLRRAPKAAPRPEAETKRWLEAAPALADQGLSKSEAARQVGATPSAFSIAVNHHLPELKWKCGNPLNAQDQRFVCSVPKLAIAGKTKAGAAVALGMDLPAFESKLAALAKYLPDIVWADGANGWSVTH